jgi:hypothetical protein
MKHSLLWGILTMLLLSQAVPASQAITVSLVPDMEALPVLVRITIDGGVPPFHVAVVSQSDLGTPINQLFTLQGREISVPAYSNSPGPVTVAVTDGAGSSCHATGTVGRVVCVNEWVAIDAARLSDTPADGTWEQVTDLGDDTYCSTTPVSIQSMAGGRARVMAGMPGAYYLRLSAGSSSVKLVVKPASTLGIEIRGMLQDYYSRPLGFSFVENHLERMRRVGVNAIEFVKFIKIGQLTDNDLQDPSPFPYWEDLLRCAIQQAKAAGFRVMLRMVYSLDAPWPITDDVQRLCPDNWDTWFSNFSKLVLRYGQLAQDTGVDIYVFADSLFSTYAFEQRYRDLIAALRGVFSGSLTVGAGTWRSGGLDTVRFWDALDYIGVTGCLLTQQWGVPYDQAVAMDVDQVTEIYRRLFEREILPTALEFQKPLLWVEVFYTSLLGSTFSPSGVPFWHEGIRDATYQTTPSYAEQAKGYAATLRVLEENEQYTAGVFADGWPFGDPEGLEQSSKGGFNIRATPAEEVFSIWWGPDVSQTSMQYPPTCTSFAELTQRGSWWLEGPSGTTSPEEELLNKGQPDEMRRLRVATQQDVPSSLVFALNAGAWDHCVAGYSGVVVVASSESPIQVRIRLEGPTAAGDEASALSAPVTLSAEPSIVSIPFSAFLAGEFSVQFARICQISIEPVTPGGIFYVWSSGIGLYRHEDPAVAQAPQPGAQSTDMAPADGVAAMTLVDDFEDRDFTNLLGGAWGTISEEAWALGGSGWHFFSLAEDVKAALRARRTAAEVVDCGGDLALAWRFTGIGLVKLSTWLPTGPRNPGFDGSGFDGVYLVASSDADVDVTASIDYRHVGLGSPGSWELRSVNAQFCLKRGQRQSVRIPFLEFSLDDPAWRASPCGTFQDVNRSCLEVMGLMVRAQDAANTIFVHEVGFYSD